MAMNLGYPLMFADIHLMEIRIFPSYNQCFDGNATSFMASW